MATIGFRGLALIFGAGYSGTYLYNNLDRARNLATEILLKHQESQNQSSQSSNSTSTNTDIEALSRQMNQIASQVSQQSRNEPVVIMSGNHSGYRGSISTVSDVLNLLGWAVVAVTVGGVVYFVAYRKNVSLKDLAWVSQSTFNGTIEAMQHGITRVKGMVSAVKRDLSQRLHLLEGRVDQVGHTLGEQIDREVTDVKKGVSNVGKDVADVQDFLRDVNDKVLVLSKQMDTATCGIFALVRVVATMAPDQLPAKSPFHQLKELASISNAAARQEGDQLPPSHRHRLSTGLGSLLEQGKTTSDFGDPLLPELTNTKSKNLRNRASMSADAAFDSSWKG